jgi:methylenetetrahydrofolate reductase (NADPH)
MGLRLCAETIQELAELPGVTGVHVMAFGFEHGVPEILERAGIGPRVTTVSTTAEGSANAR